MMNTIIKTCFNQTNEEIIEILESLLLEHEVNYSQSNISILEEDEIKMLKFLISTFQNSKRMPSQDIFILEFERYKEDINRNSATVPIEDLEVYIGNFIFKRCNKGTGSEIGKIGKKIERSNFSEQEMERIN